MGKKRKKIMKRTKKAFKVLSRNSIATAISDFDPLSRVILTGHSIINVGRYIITGEVYPKHLKDILDND